jgi:hypothetical protein
LNLAASTPSLRPERYATTRPQERRRFANLIGGSVRSGHLLLRL